MTIHRYLIEEIRPAYNRIVDHYPRAVDAAKAMGISQEAFYRIKNAEGHETLRTPVALKILHRADNLGPTGPGKLTGADVAAYALTPEGHALVLDYRAGRRAAA